MGRAQRRKHDRVPAPRPPEPARPRPRAAHSGAAAADRTRALLAPTLLIAVGLALYANSFSIPFLFDDYFEIANNPAVKTLEPLTDYLRRSRGIPALSFALNYRWDGFDVWSFHLVNIVVHLVNGLLVYALVLRTLRLPFFQRHYDRHARVLAALVALVFIAHPLQTMAASYIVQRAESIASGFYLATLVLVGAAAAQRGTRRALLYAAAAVCALLGVISKEIVATVPLMALLYRQCFLAETGRGSRLRRLAVWALLALPLAYALVLARPYLLPAVPTDDAGVPRAWLFIPTAGFQVQGIGSWQYLLTQFGVLCWYLRLFLLPTAQCFDYGWPFADSLWRAGVLLPLGIVVALAAAAVLAYRRYRLATFCLAWFFIVLAPTSSIIPLRDAAFEHRAYLALVGLAWLVVVGGYDALTALAARTGASAQRLWTGGTVAAALWIAGLGVATLGRNQVLADPLRLAADSVAKAPHNWRAHYALGDALAQQQRVDEAIAALEQSIQLDPHQGAPRVQLGSLYARRRRFADAERVLAPATMLQEESVVAAAYLQLASVHQGRGDLGGAAFDLQRAVALKPDWAAAHQQLGYVYARQTLWFAAAAQYGTAIRLNPKLAAALGPEAARASYAAAVAFDETGKRRAAFNMLRAALSYRPQWPAVQHYLAYVEAGLGEWTEAEQELEHVAAAAPTDPLVAENLRRARARQPLLPPPTEPPPPPRR